MALSRKTFKYILFFLSLNATFFLACLHGAPPVLHSHAEAEVRRVLAREAPHLEIKAYNKLRDTYSNMVVEINGEWIFRFPLSQKVAESVEKEARLLELLEDKTDFLIPHYEYIGKSVSMAGYRKIEGVSFSKETYFSMSDQAQERIAEELAWFLYQMHTAISPEIAESLGFKNYYFKIENLKNSLFGTFEDPELNKLLEKSLQAFEEQSMGELDIAILHNDFHGGNMAYDIEYNHLNGVFDFTNATLGNPALDLSYLFTIGPDLVRRAAYHYSAISGIPNLYFQAKVIRIIRLSEQILKARDKGDKTRLAWKLCDLKRMAELWRQEESTSNNTS